MEEMALEYFRGMDPGERKKLIKKIFSLMSEEEKLEIAKFIVNQK